MSLTRKSYRIERYWEVPGEWKTVMVWHGLPKGKTDGAMMVLKAFHGNTHDYRAICEQTEEVYETAIRSSIPKTNQQLANEFMQDLASEQVECDPEMTHIINENFWDLI